MRVPEESTPSEIEHTSFEELSFREKAARAGKAVLYVLRTGDLGIRLRKNHREDARQTEN